MNLSQTRRWAFKCTNVIVLLGFAAHYLEKKGMQFEDELEELKLREDQLYA